MRHITAQFHIVSGGALRTVLLGMLFLGSVQSGEAQSRSNSQACEVVASVLGGGTGLVVGLFVGGRVERAVSEGEDAGLTGALVGGVVGAVLGVRLATRACDRPGEEQLRQRFSNPTSETFGQHISVVRRNPRCELAHAGGRVPAELCQAYRTHLLSPELSSRRTEYQWPLTRGPVAVSSPMIRAEVLPIGSMKSVARPLVRTARRRFFDPGQAVSADRCSES